MRYARSVDGYVGNSGPHGDSNDVVDVWDFLHWLTEEQYGSLPDAVQRSLRRACQEQRGRISISIIDKALVALDSLEMLDALYPYEDTEL